MLVKVLGVALAGSLLAAACGGGGSDTDEGALEDRARDAAQAFIDEERRDAYEFYSEECREKVSYSEFSASMRAAAAILEGFSGVKLKDLEIAEVKTRNVEDDSGEVLVRIRSKEDPDEDIFGGEEEWETWEVEDGKWVNPDCSQMSFAFDGDDDDDDDTPPVTVTVRTPSSGSTSGPASTPTPGVKPKVGQAVTVGDAKYTVNEVRDNLPGDRFSTPEAGKRWLAFDITIEALKQTDYNPFDFTVQDANAFVYEHTFVFGGPEPDLQSGDLASGERVRGWIAFEVPAEAKLSTIRVEEDFGKPVVVIADLAAP